MGTRKNGKRKETSKSQEDSRRPGEWPIPGLREGKYKMSLEHLVSNSKGMFKECWGQIQRIQEPT